MLYLLGSIILTALSLIYAGRTIGDRQLNFSLDTREILSGLVGLLSVIMLTAAIFAGPTVSYILAGAVLGTTFVGRNYSRIRRTYLARKNARAAQTAREREREMLNRSPLDDHEPCRNWAIHDKFTVKGHPDLIGNNMPFFERFIEPDGLDHEGRPRHRAILQVFDKEADAYMPRVYYVQDLLTKYHNVSASYRASEGATGVGAANQDLLMNAVSQPEEEERIAPALDPVPQALRPDLTTLMLLGPANDGVLEGDEESNNTGRTIGNRVNVH